MNFLPDCRRNRYRRGGGAGGLLVLTLMLNAALAAPIHSPRPTRLNGVPAAEPAAATQRTGPSGAQQTEPLASDWMPTPLFDDPETTSSSSDPHSSGGAVTNPAREAETFRRAAQSTLPGTGAQLRDAPEPEPDGPDSARSIDSRASSGSLEPLTSRKTESMSRLKRQLQQLRTLVDLQLRLQASKQQSAQSDSRPLAAEGQPATISHGATEQAPSAPGLPATGDASPAVANMLLAGQRIAAEAMVQTPVDRIALGDNLFAAGEVALALEIYRQAEAGDLSEDERLWIRYQTASCQRRLNLRQDAERSYRSLVGLPNAGWYALQSRWWLDALEARQGLEQELARIRQTVQTLEQSLHAPQTP